MCRCPGYRPTNANRAEVEQLRAELGSLRSYEWIRARVIMREIAEIVGHTGGPTGGLITPRACRYCDYYGHTRQWCQKRMADERRRDEMETDKIIAQNRRERARLGGHHIDKEWSARVQELMERYDAACDAGHGCVGGTEMPCEECEGCKGWDRFMEEYDAKRARTK